MYLLKNDVQIAVMIDNITRFMVFADMLPAEALNHVQTHLYACLEGSTEPEEQRFLHAALEFLSAKK